MKTAFNLPQKAGRNGLGAGVWNLGPGTDPFGGPTRESIPILDRLPILAQAGMTYYEAHDVEIPASQVSAARKRAEEVGLQCGMYRPSFFSVPIFNDGPMTSHDLALRSLSLKNALEPIDSVADFGGWT